MSRDALSATQFENLLPKFLTVLEVSQNPEGVLTPQNKQALLQATNNFREELKQAKDAATTLPGGELLMEEQDEIIAMLEQLKRQKRDQLRVCSKMMPYSPPAHAIKMDIDSAASTPVGS